MKAEKADKFRLKVDENMWSEVELEDNPISLEGKRLHLFQLPPDMPVSCLHGLELPAPRKNKWSKPITVSYTANKGKANEQVIKVELKGQRTKNQQTLMEAHNGKLSVCGTQPISIYQGFQVVDAEEAVIPKISEGVHQLPAGLRQRFIPIGNGLGTKTVKDAEEVIAKAKTPAGHKRKHKSLTSSKIARMPEDVTRSTESQIQDNTPDRPKEKRKRTVNFSDSDTDATEIIPVKKIKKDGGKSSSSVSASPLKQKKKR